MVLDWERRPRGGGEGQPASTLSFCQGTRLGRTAGGESRMATGAGRRSGQERQAVVTRVGRVQARGG
jgi:hypothetical protein